MCLLKNLFFLFFDLTFFFSMLTYKMQSKKGFIMTAIRKKVKVVLKTRKWMLSLNYIPAGT